MIERRDRGRNCGTCDYWQPLEEFPKDRPCSGTCHKGPPIYVSHITVHSDGDFNIPLPVAFPDVTNEDWCGEYREAPGMNDEEDE